MKKLKLNEYDITKDMISQIKLMSTIQNKKHYINEEKENHDAIAITNDPKFGQNVLRNQIASFKQAVHGGAKFSEENNDNPKSNPLVFFPKTGNLVFSGSIPSLADLKFQFSLNDVTGAPYIFVEGLSLTEETITTLNKMKGFYENWKDEWFAAGDLLDKLGKEEN
jgi:hypothetical protein